MIRKHNQVIHSRFEFYIGDKPAQELFDELNASFEQEYDEDGVQIGGASAAKNLDSKTAIILTYSKEADHFLRLKYYGRNDVKFHCYKPKKKEVENE